jgi:glutamate/tyrosine decarboxylase-like PLP-dependent enzyme
MNDFNDLIMPGITHWQHPQFHAYFPSGNSYPSILGDLLSSGLGIIGFSWSSSPACTELETIIMNWLGKMVGLDESLLPFSTQTNQSANSLHTGGGVILVTLIKIFSYCRIKLKY